MINQISCILRHLIASASIWRESIANRTLFVSKEFRILNNATWIENHDSKSSTSRSR